MRQRKFFLKQSVVIVFFSLLTEINNVTSSKEQAACQTANLSNQAPFQMSFFLDKTVRPVLPTIGNNNANNLTIDGSETDKAINNELAINDEPITHIIISSQELKEKIGFGQSSAQVSYIMTGLIHSLVSITKSSPKFRFLLEDEGKWLNDEIKQNLKSLVSRTSYYRKRANKNNDFSDIFNEIGLSNFIIKSGKRKKLLQAIDFFLMHAENIKIIFKNRFNIPIKTLLIIKALLQSSQVIRGDIVIIEKTLVDFLNILRPVNGKNNKNFTSFYQKISGRQFKIDLSKMPHLNDFFNKIQLVKFLDENPHLSESELINNNDVQTKSLALELIPNHRRETIEINNNNNNIDIQEPARKKRCVNTQKELNEILYAILTLLRSSKLRMISSEQFPSFRTQLIDTIRKIESALGRDVDNFLLDEVIERGALTNQELTAEDIEQINQVISYLINQNNQYSSDGLLNETFLLFQLVMNGAIKICGDVEIIKVGLLHSAKKILIEAINCDSFFSLLTIINNVTSSKKTAAFQTTNIRNPALFFQRSFFLDKTVCPVLPKISNNNTDNVIIEGTDKTTNNELPINGKPVKTIIVKPKALKTTKKRRVSGSQSSPSVSYITTGLLHSLITITKSSTNIQFLWEQDKNLLNDEINQNLKNLVARTSYSWHIINNNCDFSDIFNEVGLSNFIIEPKEKRQLLQAIDFFLTHTENIKSFFKYHFKTPIKTLLILKLLLQSSQEIKGDLVIVEKALVEFLSILSLPEGENNTNFIDFYKKISGQQFKVDLSKMPHVNDFFNKIKQIKFLDKNPHLSESELINNNDMQTKNMDLELVPSHSRETIEISNNNNYIDIDTVKDINNNNGGNTYLLHNCLDGDIQEPASKKRCLNTHKELNEMLDAILTLLRSSELRMIPKEHFPSFRSQLIDTINKIESALGRDGNNFFLDKIIERGILTNQELTAEDIGQINQVISYLIDQNNTRSNDELLNDAFLLTSLIINAPMNIGGNLAVIKTGLLNAAKAILPETKNCGGFSSLIAEINSVRHPQRLMDSGYLI